MTISARLEAPDARAEQQEDDEPDTKNQLMPSARFKDTPSSIVIARSPWARSNPAYLGINYEIASPSLRDDKKEICRQKTTRKTRQLSLM